MVVHRCECCNFSTQKIWTYKNHVTSKKHIDLQTSAEEYSHNCEYCTSKYKTQSGLWKHKQTCEQKPPPSPTLENTLLERITHLENEVNQICEKIPPSENVLLERISQLEHEISQSKKVTPVVEIQYIYLIQEREFIKTNEPIYKIGKTKKENLTRFKQYSKGSMMLCQLISTDCDEDERVLLGKFRDSYVPRRDIGSEYFEGDCNRMIQDIYETICKKS